MPLGRSDGIRYGSATRCCNDKHEVRSGFLRTVGRTIILVSINGCEWSKSPMASARMRIILVGEMGVHAYTQGSTLSSTVSLANDAPSKHSGSGGHTPFLSPHRTP